jgi:hypothetical protein
VSREALAAGGSLAPGPQSRFKSLASRTGELRYPGSQNASPSFLASAASSLVAQWGCEACLAISFGRHQWHFSQVSEG